jgi:peptide/nickel transport system substrate-binding protein
MGTHLRHPLGAVLLAMAGLAAPHLAAAQDITVAIGSEPSTLDPQLRDDGGERQVNDNIYETLMARTPTGELVPGLAVEAPTQVDDLTWEFRLREGVSFHNGEPFNAGSVVASVTRVMDPANASEQLGYYGPIVEAQKVDDLTVRIVTSAPDPILPSRMYWMKMIPAGYAETGDLAAAPVGTGPYMFDTWNRGTDLRLVANPDYWGREPQIDSVTYRFIPEAGTRLSGLMAGEFDVITNLLPEFTAQVPNFAAVPGLETSVLVLGTDNEVTSDVRVREAINLAIDRQAMADALFQGYAQVANGIHVNPAAFGHHAALQSYAYDPERARQLIAEAGAEGAAITVVGEAGRWLKSREQVEAVAAYWSEIGLDVTVDIQEFSMYLDSLMGDGPRPDAIFIANSNELLDADRESSFIFHMDGAAASNSNAELAALIDAARVETDVAAREGMYHEIQQAVHDGHYTVPLFNLQDVYGLSERMQWTPRPDAKLLISEMQVAE